MKQTYQVNGKQFVAQVNGNTLTMYVPREPDRTVTLKVLKKHRSRLGHAIKRDCFDSFAAVVDDMEG